MKAREDPWRDEKLIKSEIVHQNQAKVDGGFKGPGEVRTPGNKRNELGYRKVITVDKLRSVNMYRTDVNGCANGMGHGSERTSSPLCRIFVLFIHHWITATQNSFWYSVYACEMKQWNHEWTGTCNCITMSYRCRRQREGSLSFRAEVLRRWQRQPETLTNGKSVALIWNSFGFCMSCCAQNYHCVESSAIEKKKWKLMKTRSCSTRSPWINVM